MYMTVATYITCVRIGMTPWIVVMLCQAYWNWACGLYMVAVGTDVLDGYIARRYNQQSRLGQLLDPVADKILIITLLCYGMVASASEIYGSLQHMLSIWLVLKECILLVGAAFLYMRYRIFIKPSLLSRASGLAEMAYIFIELVHHVLPMPLYIRLGSSLLASVLAGWLLCVYGVLVYAFLRNEIYEKNRID